MSRSDLKAVGARMAQSDIERLDLVAEAQRVKRSFVIIEAVNEYVNRYIEQKIRGEQPWMKK